MQATFTTYIQCTSSSTSFLMSSASYSQTLVWLQCKVMIPVIHWFQRGNDRKLKYCIILCWMLASDHKFIFWSSLLQELQQKSLISGNAGHVVVGHMCGCYPLLHWPKRTPLDIPCWAVLALVASDEQTVNLVTKRSCNNQLTRNVVLPVIYMYYVIWDWVIVKK